MTPLILLACLLDDPVTLTGHAKAVTCAAISHGNSRPPAGSEDGSIIVWDIAWKKQDRSLTGHQSPVRQLVSSVRDSNRLFSGGGKPKERGELFDWNVDTAQCTPLERAPDGPLYTMVTFPDGHLNLRTVG